MENDPTVLGPEDYSSKLPATITEQERLFMEGVQDGLSMPQAWVQAGFESENRIDAARKARRLFREITRDSMELAKEFLLDDIFLYGQLRFLIVSATNENAKVSALKLAFEVRKLLSANYQTGKNILIIRNERETKVQMDDGAIIDITQIKEDAVSTKPQLLLEEEGRNVPEESEDAI